MADPAVRTLYSKYVNAYTVHEVREEISLQKRCVEDNNVEPPNGLVFFVAWLG